MAIEAFFLEHCAGRSILTIHVKEEIAKVVFGYEVIERPAHVKQQLLDQLGPADDELDPVEPDA